MEAGTQAPENETQHDTGTRRRSPWATLAVLAIAQFMVVLDVTIVNVALPSLQASLHFSPDDLQWVISAYTLAFGGFLLLGGRLSDLLGRRRIFSAGLALFSVASLAGRLASSTGVLAVIFGVIRAEPLGWGSFEVLGSLAAGAALLAAFVAVEARSADPLVPLRLFRSGGLSKATGALALNGASFLAMFFLTALYLQQVRGLSAL